MSLSLVTQNNYAKINHLQIFQIVISNMMKPFIQFFLITFIFTFWQVYVIF